VQEERSRQEMKSRKEMIISLEDVGAEKERNDERMG
jgi:hypothetical protein